MHGCRVPSSASQLGEQKWAKLMEEGRLRGGTYAGQRDKQMQLLEGLAD